MNDHDIIRRLSEAIRRREKKPSAERFAEMVRRGVIDQEGRVLLRMEPPPGRRPSGRKPSSS